jgi:orotidine-5'-phosphate decarboxylase
MPIPERLNPSFGSSLPSAPVQTDPMEEARRRLIVALDVPSAKAAIELVNKLESTCQWFKVGMELFVAAGPAVLEPLVARGHSIFLDLKFIDIPNTVAGAVRSAAGLGVKMMTVHAAGGPAMLAAARGALDGMTDPPELLAVSVLTSMDQDQLKATGVARTPATQAELLVRMGMAAGFRGFVCSPEEAATLRAITGPEGVLVTPGIRPSGSAVGDQTRIATPGEALRQGASYLVVGRPINKAKDPAEAAAGILNEMAKAIDNSEI